MELLNDTPFKHFVFESLDAKDRRVAIAILQGTFRFRPNSRMVIADEQEEINLSDEYFGAPLKSSLRLESQLAPVRFGTDITLDSIAYAPSRTKCQAWEVAVKVGAHQKSLRVTGPRQWSFGLTGWKLSDPEPVESVPVRYELAYGGQYEVDGKVTRFEKNPIGLGYVNRKRMDPRETVPAPQIESPNTPIREIFQIYEPEGFGPIPKHYLPRRELCGTADEAWVKGRWPNRPADFNFAYYNAASPGLLTATALRGDEMVELWGLSIEGLQVTALPALTVKTFTLTSRRDMAFNELKLDSVHLVPHQQKAILTWRAQARRDSDLSVMQFLIESTESVR